MTNEQRRAASEEILQMLDEDELIYSADVDAASAIIAKHDQPAVTDQAKAAADQIAHHYEDGIAYEVGVSNFAVAVDTIARIISRAIAESERELVEACVRLVNNSRDADCGDHCPNSCMWCQARAALAKRGRG